MATATDETIKDATLEDAAEDAYDETDPGADPIEPDDVEEETEVLPDNVRKLPLHSLADKDGIIKVKRSRGRPRTVNRKPDISDLEYHAEMSEEKRKYIATDPVVIAASGHGEAMVMLRVIRSEIAKEQAALAFQRGETEKYGKDTAQVSSRRIEALTKIANIELEMKKLGGDVVDFRGERFQKVFQLWVSTLQEIAEEILSPEQIDLFFNRFATKMDGWEDRASSVAR